MVKLSDVAVIVTGGTPKTSDPSLYGGAVPFVTPSELVGNIPVTDTPRRLTKKGAEAVRIVPANSIMVCCIGSLGKIGIAGTAVATNQQINSVIFDQRSVDVRYGFYACQRLENRLKSMAPATTVPIVSKSKFQNLEIPLPPLFEQKRIASILDQADDIRRKARLSLAKVELLGQACFQSMFGNPATNTKDWKMVCIGDLLSEAKYGTSEKANTEGRGIPILRMGNITYDGRIDLTDIKHVELSGRDLPKYTTRRGDILFNRTNSQDLVGKTAVVQFDQPMAIAGYLVRARTNQNASPAYISAYLNSAHGKTVLRNMCNNIVGMANINAQQMQKIKIAAPPVDMQLKYSRMIDEMQERSGPMREAMDYSDALFSSLQHRAFRGEL